VRLQIAQIGEEVLRRPANQLSREDILSAKTQELIEHMRDTMQCARCRACCPQVGVPLQLAAIEDCEEYHQKLSPSRLSERQRQPVPFHVIVNPRIVSADNKGVEFFEGCLSVAGYSAIVPRARAVTVEYLNEHGGNQKGRSSGLVCSDLAAMRSITSPGCSTWIACVVAR
jgi:peptide deformylase